jgi:diacylglycerol kinase family enzyme
MDAPPAKIAVVLNGASGTALGLVDPAAVLERLLRKAGFDPLMIPPEAGSLKARMEAGAASGAAMLVAAGGDGSIACAVDAMRGADMVLGIVPLGTVNLLAIDLGIPLGNMAAAVAVLRGGRIRRIDAGEVNGRLFLCGSVLGLPARLARYREAGRGKGSMTRLWLRVARAAWRAFARYGTPRADLRIGGRRVRTRAAAINITPSMLNDATGRVFGRDRLDEGVLGVYAIRHVTLRSILRIGFRALIGQWSRDRDVTAWRTERLVVRRLGRKRPKTLRLMIDGEVTLMAPPLNFRILPGAVRVVAP